MNPLKIRQQAGQRQTLVSPRPFGMATDESWSQGAYVVGNADGRVRAPRNTQLDAVARFLRHSYFAFAEVTPEHERSIMRSDLSSYGGAFCVLRRNAWT